MSSVRCDHINRSMYVGLSGQRDSNITAWTAVDFAPMPALYTKKNGRSTERECHKANNPNGNDQDTDPG
jgi:hypothetical protein